MTQHKHVEMTTMSVTGIDDKGKPVIATHKAVMDVPVSDLDAFINDASGKWQQVSVSDDCPEHCTAQLTVADSGERDKKLKVAHKLRAADGK